MAWAFMALAILLETVGTGLLKLSHGFERVGIGGLSMLSYGVCFFFLALALRVIPVGAAYAIWSGVGTALVVLAGVFLFGEKMTLLKAGLIAMIVVGAAGLMLLIDSEA
ncbi:MAG: multidrug efflux SMR transporter [Alphaproteobacteria bacterium]|nr:multidrug efflux SMR transporter [Alphaproteobacteria bacterium]